MKLSEKVCLGMVLIFIICIMPMVTAAEESTNQSSFFIKDENMEPFLKRNDSVMTSNSTSFDSLKIGDVIAFRAPEEAQYKTPLSVHVQLREKEKAQNAEDTQYETLSVVVKWNNEFCQNSNETHPIKVSRISDIGTIFDKRVVKTKADANPDSIPGIDFPLFKENYIGKVVSVTHNTTEKQRPECTYNISHGTLSVSGIDPDLWVFDGTLKAIKELGTTKITKIYPFSASLSRIQITDTPDNSTELLKGRIDFDDNALPDFEDQYVNGNLTIHGQNASLDLSGSR